MRSILGKPIARISLSPFQTTPKVLHAEHLRGQVCDHARSALQLGMDAWAAGQELDPEPTARSGRPTSSSDPRFFDILIRGKVLI
jgi:hypothetical protein